MKPDDHFELNSGIRLLRSNNEWLMAKILFSGYVNVVANDKTKWCSLVDEHNHLQLLQGSLWHRMEL